MRQIAQHAGIALGGLYNHFASKEEVFREVFMEYHPYRTVVPMIINARRDTFEQFISDAFYYIIAVLRDKPDFMKLMFVEMVEFNSRHVQEMFVAIFPQLFPIVEDIVRANQEQLRPIHPVVIMRAFIGSFFAFYLTETMLGQHAPPEFAQDAEEHFIQVFLGGVLKSMPQQMEEAA
jgi:AcrR family transcriptional regulator